MAKPLIKCGENRRQGGVFHGFGFGGSKTAARRAAIGMSNSLISAVYKGQLAALQCPEKCPRRAAEGVVNVRNRDLASVQILPGLFYCAVQTTYDLVLVCK